MNHSCEFRQKLAVDLEKLFSEASSRFPSEDTLRMDLHCHDLNSDRPDEILGRILGIPETWVTTEEVVSTLQSNRVDVVTVTNHNNARTCWNLMDKGMDVLPAAEFSCTLGDFNVGIHVLTYGFTPAQETRLQSLRRDVYRFVEYCSSNDIPTVLAHPLQFHSPDGLPPMEVMDRLGLLFERFEVVNGQRDSWQNLLSASWVQGMDEEEIRAMAKRARQPADLFVRNPYRKRMTGGSDDHMAMFAGSSGTLLHVPNLKEKRNSGQKLSLLALEALRNGDLAPYGDFNEEEKLAAALLDYFCQVTLNMEDPGLMRLLLHKGSSSDRFLALAVANGVFELRRHKVAMGFLKTVHESLAGKNPGLATRLATRKDFYPLLNRLKDLAIARRKGSKELAQEVDRAFPDIHRHLWKVLSQRVHKKRPFIEKVLSGMQNSKQANLEETKNSSGLLDISANFRQLFTGESKSKKKKSKDSLGLAGLADGLPYPLLAAGVIAGASFAAARVLHDKRPFLDAFAAQLGQHTHPHRALWLTDTLEDRNGVSHALRSLLTEIVERDLPIDLCVVSDTLQEEPHLRVLRPVGVFESEAYPQSLRIPDVLEVQKLFHRGGYDRIVSSTEGPMGALALYLKHAFEVPAWFFVHTDWLDFARTTLGWDSGALSRTRRLLRSFYQSFDGLFVLNQEMREWLAGPQMGIPEAQLHSTAHWPDARFSPREAVRSVEFSGVLPSDPVLLFAGRISDEKGVNELPEIWAKVRSVHPRTRLVLAGTGPAEERLRAQMPDAIWLGWCDQERLARAFSSADLLILPSRFDTFGCVVLEAMACRLPVAAYGVKGPKDLIEPGLSGILADSAAELAMRVTDVLNEPARLEKMRAQAQRRAGEFTAQEIVDRLLVQLDFGVPKVGLRREETLKSGKSFFRDILEVVQEGA